MDAQHFKTQEAILAFCLDKAGCEFLDANQPCANILDSEILAKLGHRGKPLWEAAQEAWENGSRGHVEYIFKQTPRLMDLIRAYRDQCEEIQKPGGNSTLLTLDIIGRLTRGEILQDEALIRLSCIDLKTRIDFVNIWKEMVPILRVPRSGKTKNFDTTVLSQGKRVQANAVEKPGFTAISLNASEATRKHLGL